MLKLLLLTQKYRPVAALAALAVFHLASGTNLKDLVADLEGAARDLGVPIPEALEVLLPLLTLAGQSPPQDPVA